MKTILVPIDYSRDSRNALSFALETAHLTGSDIILLHAFFPVVSPPAAYDVADVVLALEEARTKDLAAFAHTVVQELTGNHNHADGTAGYDSISIRYVARMGTAFEQILKALGRYQVDLVIMGMQGGGAISQAVLGSTTLSVMQASLVPVLAIPREVIFTPFRSVVFAVNLSKLPATVDLHLLRGFLLACQAKLHVLHLYRTHEQQAKFDAGPALEVIAQKLEGVPYHVAFDVAGDVAAGIQRFVQEKAADLLVLLPQKHTFLERLLDRSVMGRITAHPLVPLLALPSGALPPVATTAAQEMLAN